MTTTTCNCGFEIPFEDIDRGERIYCPSCGISVLVPATVDQPKPPADQADSNIQVFTNEGIESTTSRVLGQVSCLCGTVEDYYLDDVGGTIYCSSCGAGISCGGKLGKQFTPVAHANVENDSTPAADRSLLPSVNTIIAIGVLSLISVIAMGSIVAWRSSNRQLVLLDGSSFVHQTSSGEFDPDKLTLENIQELIKQPDAFEALQYALSWKQAVGAIKKYATKSAAIDQVTLEILENRCDQMLVSINSLSDLANPKAALEQAEEWQPLLEAAGLSADDQRLVKLEEIIQEMGQQLNAITTEMIADLLDERHEAIDALTQAGIWKAELIDTEVPPTDARRQLIEEVITKLEKRLEPNAAETLTHVSEFRKLVNEYSKQLRSGDSNALSVAIKIRKRGQQMLNDYPDDLAAFSRRFYALMDLHDRMILEKVGVDRIGKHLDKLEEITEAGDVNRLTEAIEAKAHAKALALRTPMTPAEADELDQRILAVSRRSPDNPCPPLVFLRAQRAVADAKRFDDDKPARMFATHTAAKLLPGLPSDKVKSMVESIEPWVQQLRARPNVAKKTPLSDAGQTARQRHYYEISLDHYGNGDAESVLDVCVEMHDQLTAEQRSNDEYYGKSVSLLFKTVEANVQSSLNERSSGSLDNLALARRTLDRVAYWKSHPKWKTLNGAVSARGDQIGKGLIEQAEKLAKTDKLNEAVATIETAIDVCGPANSEVAKSLQRTWRQELKMRNDEQAAEKLWQEIELTANNPGMDSESISHVQAWYNLNQYVKKFPRQAGLKKEEIGRLRQILRDHVHRHFDELYRRANLHIDKREWRLALERHQEISSIAETIAEKAKQETLKARLDGARLALQGEFQLLSRVERNMTASESIPKVLRITSQLAILDPHHGKALALLAKAKERGGKWAARLLGQVENRKRLLNRNVYRNKLRRASQMDPYGASGRRARQLLAEFEATSAQSG